MKKITIFKNGKGSSRIEFGLERLEAALREAGYETVHADLPENSADYRKHEGEKLYEIGRASCRERVSASV